MANAIKQKEAPLIKAILKTDFDITKNDLETMEMAISYGTPSLMAALVSKGIDLQIDPEYFLQLAAETPTTSEGSALDFLIAEGIDAQKYGADALDIAYQSSEKDHFTTLLNLGAGDSQLYKELLIEAYENKDDDFAKLLQPHCNQTDIKDLQFTIAFDNDDWEKIKEILKKGEKITDATLADEMLQEAIEIGDENAVKYCLSGRKAPLTNKTDFLHSAIFEAIEYPEIIRSLIANGAQAKNIFDEDVLEHIYENDAWETLIILAKDGIDLNKNRGAYLEYALDNEYYDLAQILLKLGAKTDIDNGRLYQTTFSNEDYEAFSLLLNHSDANILKHNSFISQAADEGYDAVWFSKMIAYGDNPNKALRPVIENENNEALALLLSHGADANHQNGAMLKLAKDNGWEYGTSLLKAYTLINSTPQTKKHKAKTKKPQSSRDKFHKRIKNTPPTPTNKKP